MEVQTVRTSFLLVIHHLLVIGVHSTARTLRPRPGRAPPHRGYSARWSRVEIGQVLAGGVLVLGQVVVGAVRHAPQLAPAEGEQELKVRGGLGVEAQLLGSWSRSRRFSSFMPGKQPVWQKLRQYWNHSRSVPGLQKNSSSICSNSRTESEVARGDLVAEGLADLAHAEGQLAAGGALDVAKLTKMPWAVSGRRYTVFLASSVTPWKVLNIRLNCGCR